MCAGSEPSCESVAEAAAGHPDFSVLSKLVAAADLAEVLADPGFDYTLFAPDNIAFAELAPGADIVGLLSENRDMLDAVRPPALFSLAACQPQLGAFPSLAVC